jgi:hypothetical protein
MNKKSRRQKSNGQNGFDSKVSMKNDNKRSKRHICDQVSDVGGCVGRTPNRATLPCAPSWGFQEKIY